MKEKQIEEMANELALLMLRDINLTSVCTKLYNAGYRKQSEGEDTNVPTEWISVDERLPEDVYGKDRKHIVVLVHTKSGRISSASRVRVRKWDKTKLEWVTTDKLEWSRVLRVTHWMPLPDAPKGGNND